MPVHVIKFFTFSPQLQINIANKLKNKKKVRAGYPCHSHVDWVLGPSALYSHKVYTLFMGANKQMTPLSWTGWLACNSQAWKCFGFLKSVLFFKYYIELIYLPYYVACRLLIPRPGIEPKPPEVQAWSFNQKSLWKCSKLLCRVVFQFLLYFLLNELC